MLGRTETMTMTPQSKRKKRPSLSPKQPGRKRRTRLSEPINLSIPPLDSNDDDQRSGEFDTTLNFYDDSEKKFRDVTSADRKQVLKELREQFPQVSAVTIVPPFIFVESDPVPDPTETPFLIGGLVAKFITEDEGYPWGASFMGDQGAGDPGVIPDFIVNDLKSHHIPCLDTFKFIFKLVPLAENITSYPEQLLIELRRMNDDEFIKLLSHLPDRIGEINFGYINGTEWFESQSRSKAPNPRVYDGEYDDSDYLKKENGGALRPGVIVECKGHVGPRGTIVGATLCNVGVEVCRGNQVRFTTAKHAWDTESDKVVYHANQQVGVVDETYGDDMALVKSGVRFNNEFLDIDGIAKQLMAASTFKYGEFFLIDSAFTGKQRLRVFGLRTGKRRAGNQWQGPKEDHEYVVVEQGVFAVDTPVIDSSPIVRDGVCGTPLIYAGKTPRQEKEAVEKGWVGGFMCYTNNVIPTASAARMLYCYCQTADELIEAGWEISGKPDANEEMNVNAE
jgi:hypothetical protein